MADIIGERSASAIPLRFVDKGDNTYAELVSVAGDPYTITQTIVPVTASTQQLVAANAARNYLAWMVIGTADVTVSAGASAAVVGQGMVYQSSGANKQGASQEWVSAAPTNAFQCIAASTGSSLIVWEGV